MKYVELQNELRAHPKTKSSIDEPLKEESRSINEVVKLQSMDLNKGSKILEGKKLESRASELIRVFELGQKILILLSTKIVRDMVKQNLHSSVG